MAKQLTHAQKDELIEKLKKEVINTENHFTKQIADSIREVETLKVKNGNLVDIATKLDIELKAVTALLKLKL